MTAPAPLDLGVVFPEDALREWAKVAAADRDRSERRVLAEDVSLLLDRLERFRAVVEQLAGALRTIDREGVFADYMGEPQATQHLMHLDRATSLHRAAEKVARVEAAIRSARAALSLVRLPEKEELR